MSITNVVLYPEAIIASALMDYPSDNHTPLTPMPTGMIVIEKESLKISSNKEE